MGKRFGQYLPLPGRIQVKGGIVLDVAVEQQVLVKLAQSRNLAGHGAPFHAVRKQVVNKIADILAARRSQEPLGFLQEGGELGGIGGVSGDGERGKSFLDFEVIEKLSEDG